MLLPLRALLRAPRAPARAMSAAGRVVVPSASTARRKPKAVLQLVRPRPARPQRCHGPERSVAPIRAALSVRVRAAADGAGGGADSRAAREAASPGRRARSPHRHQGLRPAPAQWARRTSKKNELTRTHARAQSRGCNGLSYTMEYATEKQRLEEEVNEHGAPTPARAAGVAAVAPCGVLPSPPPSHRGHRVRGVARADAHHRHADGLRAGAEARRRELRPHATLTPPPPVVAQDDLTSEFVFHNPNAEGACGCGESFTTNRPPGGDGNG